MTDTPPAKGRGASLTEGSLARHLVRLTVPMTIGVLAVISVGLADAFFIGQLGELELAAMSFIFPVTTALTSLGIGLSAGANTLVSQALGRKDAHGARCYAAQAIVLTAALGGVVSVAGMLLWRGLFTLLQASDEVVLAIGEYMTLWFLGFPLLALLLVCNSAIRASGNTAWPSAVMVLSAVVNIALDPLLIFGAGPLPALGMAGAAAATLVAYAVAILAMCWPLFVVVGVTTPANFLSAGYARTSRRLIAIGGPAALANALNPAGLSIVTAIVSRFGPAAVAGFGVAGRIEAFVLVPLLALSGSIGPLVGQNVGAGRFGRAGRATGLSAAFCAAYGLIVALVLTLADEPVVRLFSDSAEVRDAAGLYLRIVSWSFFGYGVLIVVNAALNAADHSVASMSLSVGRIALLYVPLALGGAALMGQAGVYGGALLANLGAAAVALLVARRYRILAAPRARAAAAP
ncbi:MAG: MATE family efflux transporter [Pseudomonadota bacterium]